MISSEATNSDLIPLAEGRGSNSLSCDGGGLPLQVARVVRLVATSFNPPTSTQAGRAGAVSARRLAAILAADVGVREHRDGTSENRANGSFPPKQSPA